MRKKGYFKVICGPMFSGKTEELLREVTRFQYSPVDSEYLLFKPKLDNRYSEDEVVSHTKNKIKAINIETPDDIMQHCKDNPEIKNIAIDEIQFIDQRTSDLTAIDLCHQLKLLGKNIIVSGLDMNFKGEPFRFMGDLMAIADKINKLHAYCSICGEKATMSFKMPSKSMSEEEIELGENDKYQARCFQHWNSKK